MSNRNGRRLPGSVSHSTVPAIVSENSKPMSWTLAEKAKGGTPIGDQPSQRCLGRYLVRLLRRAARDQERLAAAASGVLRARSSVRRMAVEAGVVRAAVRRAVQAVVLVVDVLADGRRRAQVGLEARAGVAAVVDQRRATHGAGRLRRGARDRARAAALRTGVVRRITKLATRLVAVGVRVAVALREQHTQTTQRVAVVASAAIRVGRAEAALGARAARAVAARGAVGVRAALVARAAAAAVPGPAAGGRAGRARPGAAGARAL